MPTEQQPAIITFVTIQGRTPRTLTASLLAEALRRRGARVLIVEGDLSGAGLGAALGVPTDAPSYLQTRADPPGGGSAPEPLRSLIIQHAATGIDLLLARATESQTSAGLTLNGWSQLMGRVQALTEYELVIIDMGADKEQQPYLLMAMRAGAWLLLVLAPDEKEWHRATRLIAWLGFGMGGDQPRSPLLAFLERHEDDHREIERFARNLRQEYPAAQVIGTIPRAPRQHVPDDVPGGKGSLFTQVPASPLVTALDALAVRLGRAVEIDDEHSAG